MKYVNGSFKTPKDTAGYQGNCPDYDPCPLCYGCRNAGLYPFTCDALCSGNAKINICNRELHTSANIGRMVRRQVIKLEEQ